MPRAIVSPAIEALFRFFANRHKIIWVSGCKVSEKEIQIAVLFYHSVTW
jgi:hypothetical protein